MQAIADDVHNPADHTPSSARGAPWANGEYGEIRAIRRPISRNKSPIQSLLLRRL